MHTEMSQRLQNVVVEKPIVHGNAAFPLGKEKRDDNSHRWTVYLRGINNEDMSYFIKDVTFKLHESFNEPIRVIRQPPYEVTELGWGEFTIEIIINFKDEAEEMPVVIHHDLKLFADHKDKKEVATSKKHVISETYDELVFVEPTQRFYQLLNMGNNEPIPNHFLRNYFTNQTIMDTEQKQLQRIKTAQDVVMANTDKLRARLYDVETEIAILEQMQQQQ